MIRILIADDTNLIRQALKIHFQLEPDLEVIGTAKNGKIALKLVTEFNPDIVVMDWEMPEMDGITATQIIRQFFPRTKVLIISSYESQDYIDRALQSGASGYFIKSTPAKELSKAIKLICEQNVNIIPNINQNNTYIVLPNSNLQPSRLSLSPLLLINKILLLIYRCTNRCRNILLSKFHIGI